MPYWSKVADDPIEKHDDLLSAGIRIRFAVKMGGIPVEQCAIYKRDPAKHPDEPDILPAQIRKAGRRAWR